MSDVIFKKTRIFVDNPDSFFETRNTQDEVLDFIDSGESFIHVNPLGQIDDFDQLAIKVDKILAVREVRDVV